MPVSRAELVKQLMSKQLDEHLDDTAQSSSESNEGQRKRYWNDLNSFVEENLNEVHSKIGRVETEIWGKLIAMEKNVRVAKAYLRAATITIDGGRSYFDGTRLGLGYFSNYQRDDRTAKAIQTLSRGIVIQLDRLGNIWMKSRMDRPVCIQCTQYPEPLFLSHRLQKVMDIRSFRDSIVHKLDLNASIDANKMFKKVIIFIKLADATPDTNPLDCPLWLALIHLVSVDLIHTIISGEASVALELSPQSSSDSYTSEKLTKVESLASTKPATDSPEDSSASTCSYGPENPKHTGRNTMGVARRIYIQQNARRYQSNPKTRPSPRRVDDEQRARTMSNPRPQRPVVNHDYSVPETGLHSGTVRTMENNAPRERSLSQPRLAPSGWSLLNLTDIDKMQRPFYFASAEEAERGRSMKRGGAGHRFSSQCSGYRSSRQPKPELNGGYAVSKKLNSKWLSESTLKNR